MPSENPNIQQANTRVLTEQPAISPDQLQADKAALADEILAKDHRQTEPKPEAKEKPAKYEVDEKSAENVRNFLSRGMNGQFQKQDKSDDKAQEKKAKPEAKLNKPVKKPVRPPVKPAAEATAPDIDQIIRSTAEATAAALRPKVEDAPQPKGEFEGLSPEEQSKLKVLTEMEKLAPAKYKELASKYAKSITELGKYEAQWLREHPGEDFDPKSPEHNAFFERNDVDWNDDDYVDALAEIKINKHREAIKGEVTGQLTGEISELKRKQRESELAPKLYAETKQTGREFFTGIGGEYADVVSEQGAVNQEVIAKLKENDPHWPDVATAANAVEEFAAETFRLFNNIGTYDAAKPTPLQARIVQFAHRCEQEMGQLTPQDQLDNQGRRFASNAQYSAMTPALKEKHWTYGMRELNALWAAEVQQITKNSITSKEAELEKLALRRGWKAPQAPAAPDRNKPQAAPRPVVPLEKNEPKPRSPSSNAGPQVSRPNSTPAKGEENKASSFLLRGISG